MPATPGEHMETKRLGLIVTILVSLSLSTPLYAQGPGFAAPSRAQALQGPQRGGTQGTPAGDVNAAEKEEGKAAPKPVMIAPEDRDPFWPVGYVPEEMREEEVEEVEEVVEEVFEPKWAEARKKVIVSGIMKLGAQGTVATINDQIVRAGEKVSVRYEDHKYTWKVNSIAQNRISMTPLKVD